MTCACASPEPHEVARRETADGRTVLLWSDGLVTAAMGYGIRGLGAPRRAARTSALDAGWLAMGEVSLYDFSEVAVLVKTARRAVAQAQLPPLVFLRRRMP